MLNEFSVPFVHMVESKNGIYFLSLVDWLVTNKSTVDL